MRAAELIRNARKRAGLSQTALAARARTSQPAVARYETGTATPSIATLERLLAACGSALVVDAQAAPTRVARRPGRLLVRVRRSKEALQAAARRHGVRSIRVFGSVARGDETAESDVDLLVDLDPDRTLLDLVGFQQDAEAILGVRVDAAAPRFMKERVRARAIRQARLV